MTIQNRKHSKWSAEFKKETTRLVGKKVEHTFKKDERKLKDFEFKGDVVSADAGEKVEVNDIELLFAEIEQQKKIVESKLDALAEKRGYEGDAKIIYKLITELTPKVKDWNDFTSWYNTAYARFIGKGDGTVITNGYGSGNKGWIDTLGDYLKKPVSSGVNYDNNLYKGSFIEPNGSGGQNNINFNITENEAVKLMTRVIKEIGKIDKTKFNAYINNSSTTLPTVNQFATYFPGLTLDKTNLNTWFNNLHDRAKYLVDNIVKTDKHPEKGKPANGHRVEYSFGKDFTKFQTDAAVDTSGFTDADMKQLFALAHVMRSDYNFVNHANLKTACADMGEATLTILPAKSTPLKSQLLKDFGIKGYVNTNGNSNFYETDYGNKIKGRKHNGSHIESVEWDWANKFELKVGKELNDWMMLIDCFSWEQYMDKKNMNKLISSFKDDPVSDLFDDIRGYIHQDNTTFATNKNTAGGTATPDYGCFDVGGTRYTYHDFPDFRVLSDLRLHALTAEKDGLMDEVKTGRKDVVIAQREYDAEKKKLFDKEKEVEAKITAKIGDCRTLLKNTYKIDATTYNGFGTKTDATDVNRLSEKEHVELQSLLTNIRYLESLDDTKPSSVENENTALDVSDDILRDATRVWSIAPAVCWREIGYDSSKTEKENGAITIEDRIAIIKTNANNKYDTMNLSWWHSTLENLEKLVKLSDEQQSIKTKVKEAIDQRDPQENMDDWRKTLKEIDANLETILTDEKINKWKEEKDGQKAFDNVASLKTLLEKVMVKKADGTFEKANDDFISFIGGKDAKLKTLGDLIKEKDPKDVILYIHQWEFNKLEDTKKHERYLKFAWSELGGKKEIDSKDKLEDDTEKANFDKYLYQCAIGKIVESSLTKPGQQQENENGDDKKEENGDKKHWEKYWYWYVGGGLVVAAAIGATIYFWESISKKLGLSKNQEDDDEMTE